MPLRSSERARRAIARALANTTDLVSIDDQDPDDEVPFSDAFIVSPEGIFNTTAVPTWTFARVGVNDDAAFRIFREDLLQNQKLPKKVVDNLKENNSFMGLKPSVVIGLVFELVMRELDNA
jgi:hypothetical protein